MVSVFMYKLTRPSAAEKHNTIAPIYMGIYRYRLHTGDESPPPSPHDIFVLNVQSLARILSQKTKINNSADADDDNLDPYFCVF